MNNVTTTTTYEIRAKRIKCYSGSMPVVGYEAVYTELKDLVDAVRQLELVRKALEDPHEPDLQVVKITHTEQVLGPYHQEQVDEEPRRKLVYKKGDKVRPGVLPPKGRYLTRGGSAAQIHRHQECVVSESGPKMSLAVGWVEMSSSDRGKVNEAWYVNNEAVCQRGGGWHLQFAAEDIYEEEPQS